MADGKVRHRSFNDIPEVLKRAESKLNGFVVKNKKIQSFSKTNEGDGENYKIFKIVHTDENEKNIVQQNIKKTMDGKNVQLTNKINNFNSNVQQAKSSQNATSYSKFLSTGFMSTKYSDEANQYQNNTVHNFYTSKQTDKDHLHKNLNNTAKTPKTSFFESKTQIHVPNLKQKPKIDFSKKFSKNEKIKRKLNLNKLNESKNNHIEPNYDESNLPVSMLNMFKIVSQGLKEKKENLNSNTFLSNNTSTKLSDDYTNKYARLSKFQSKSKSKITIQGQIIDQKNYDILSKINSIVKNSNLSNSNLINTNYHSSGTFEMPQPIPLKSSERKKIISDLTNEILDRNRINETNLRNFYNKKSELFKDITVRMRRHIKPTNEELAKIKLKTENFMNTDSIKQRSAKRLNKSDRKLGELILVDEEDEFSYLIDEKKIINRQKNIEFDETTQIENQNLEHLNRNKSSKCLRPVKILNKKHSLIPGTHTNDLLKSNDKINDVANKNPKMSLSPNYTGLVKSIKNLKQNFDANDNILRRSTFSNIKLPKSTNSEDHLKSIHEEKQKTYTKIKNNEKLKSWFKSNLIKVSTMALKKNKKKKKVEEQSMIGALTETYAENIDNYLKYRTERMKRKFDFLLKIDNGDIIKDELDMNIMGRIIPGNYHSIEFQKNKLKLTKEQPRFIKVNNFRSNRDIFELTRPKGNL